jgi:hypothetical protein
MSSSTPSPTLLPRRPYRGSCLCGLVTYIAYLHLPAPDARWTGGANRELTAALNGQAIYRCNCTTCHKMGIFHLRLKDAPGDFVVLSPLKADGSGLQMEQFGDAQRGLRTYRCMKKTQDWYFCGECGVRCFTLRGDCESAIVKLPASLVRGKDLDSKDMEDIEVPVWRPKSEGWKESSPCYLSINATSLDAGQEGLDLRQWHANGWVAYFEYWKETCKSANEPFEGGFY